jgi:hypothetical protein
VKQLPHATLLLIVAAVAIANVVAVGLNLPPIIRAPLAIPLVLYLPGYALALALLPPAALSRVEFLVVSVTLSIAVSALGGLLLGLTPNGLNPLSWVLMLSAVAIGGAFVASRRRSEGDRPIDWPRRWPRPSRVEVAVLGLAALAVAVILTGTTVIASRMVPPPPAQLWMLPIDGQPNEALLGMRAGTPGGPYVIRLTSSGNQIGEYPVMLGDGEQWQTTVTFNPADRTKPIVARLYQGDSTSDIRFVVLAPSTAASGGG